MSKHLRPTRTFREQIPAQQPPEPLGEPQLIWPSIKYGQGIENHDVFRFPDSSSIHNRHTAGHNGTVLKLLALEKAVREAIDLILVLDPPLNTNRSDARRVEVQWNAILDKSHFPFLHDRFAIIDGAVWHFGSTVGGGDKGLTAASGPWSATETHAMEFFEECWRSCNA